MSKNERTMKEVQKQRDKERNEYRFRFKNPKESVNYEYKVPQIDGESVNIGNKSETINNDNIKNVCKKCIQLLKAKKFSISREGVRLKNILFIITLLFLNVNCAFNYIKLENLIKEDRSYIIKVIETSPIFLIDLRMDKTYWGRAQGFVSTYSDMKIQVNTDFSIETFYPTCNMALEEAKFGYSVSKMLYGKSLKYQIICIPNCPKFYKLAEINSKILAYYIKTGEIKPHLLNHYYKE